MRLHEHAQVQRQTGKPGRGQTPLTRPTHRRRETSHLQGRPREIPIDPREIWDRFSPSPRVSPALFPGLRLIAGGRSTAPSPGPFLPAADIAAGPEAASRRWRYGRFPRRWRYGRLSRRWRYGRLSWRWRRTSLRSSIGVADSGYEAPDRQQAFRCRVSACNRSPIYEAYAFGWTIMWQRGSRR